MAKELQRLERALRAAHEAGDQEAARMFAGELRTRATPSMVAAPAPSPGPLPNDDIPSLPDPMAGPSLNRRKTFGAEEASMGQQLRLAAGYFLNADPEARKDMLRNVLGEEVKFEQDNEGNDIVSLRNETAYLNRPGFDANDAVQLAGDIVKFAPAAKLASWLGGPGLAILSRGSSAARAAIGGSIGAGATQAASEAASEAFGSEQGIDPVSVGTAAALGGGAELAAGLVPRFTGPARNALERFKQLGIDPAGGPAQQVEQIAGTTLARASRTEGAAMPEVAAGVRAAREAERIPAAAAFDRAREMSASIPLSGIQALRSRVASQMDSFDLGADGMNAIARRMEQLEELSDPSVPFNRMLPAMERWRARVSSMDPRDGSPASAAATRMKNAYDGWLDDMFNQDMIRGSPEAVQQWKSAREGWRQFKQRFDSDRVIQDLVRKDTTPEQMSQWLFNASAVGAKREAGNVVKKLNGILGADSQAMGRLRAEVVMDIAEPLMRDTPDIAAFVKNHDTWLRKNPSLKKELFPGATGRDLDDIAKISKIVSRRPGARVPDMRPADVTGRVITLLNRLVVGHQIAAGGARVQSGNAIANWVRRQASGPAARRDMLRQYLGVEPIEPLVPMATAGGAAYSNLEE